MSTLVMQNTHFQRGGVRGSVERAASTAADCERRKTIIIGINLLNFNLSKMKKKKSFQITVLKENRDFPRLKMHYHRRHLEYTFF